MQSENYIYVDLEKTIRLQGVTHKGITIGFNCWTGAKVTILNDAKVGSDCVLAAGCVVTHGKHEPNYIYGSIPTRLLKRRK